MQLSVGKNELATQLAKTLKEMNMSHINTIINRHITTEIKDSHVDNHVLVMTHPRFPSITMTKKPVKKYAHIIIKPKKTYKEAMPTQAVKIAKKNTCDEDKHITLSAISSRVHMLDHITHIDNLSSILHFGLLSHNNPHKKIDISNQEVNSRRMRRESVFYRPIHDYVPFYFNSRNAMLYKTQMDHGSNIIILGFDKSLMLNPNKVITDRNASADAKHCSSDNAFYNTLDWNKIFAKSWNQDKDLRQIMMAELLIPDCVDIEYLRCIYVKNLYAQKQVLKALFDAKIPNVDVLVAPHKFF